MPQFGSRLNVVVVRVVVRDAHGQPLGTLTKDDFEVFDNDKLQTLTGFTLKKRDSSTAAKAGTVAEAAAAAPRTHSRFTIFLFDDVHLAAEDLMRVKDASIQLLSELWPTRMPVQFSLSPAKPKVASQRTTPNSLPPLPVSSHKTLAKPLRVNALT